MHYISYSKLLRSHHPIISALLDPLYPTQCEYCGLIINSKPLLKLTSSENPFIRAQILKEYLESRLFCTSCIGTDIRINNKSAKLCCQYCGDILIESDPCPCQYASNFNENLRFRSVYTYNESIRKLIFQLKFSTSIDLCSWAALTLFTQLPKLFETPLIPARISWDLLTFIPSKIESIKSRGSYSTRYIAKTLSNLLNDIPIVELKNISNERQSSLKVKERLTTQNKFLFKNDITHLNANTAIIFDDMLTTGSSSTKAAELLLNKGIKRVDIITFARSPDFKRNYLKYLSS